MIEIIPTELSPESIEAFRELYRVHLHQEITYERAKEEGLRLLRLMVALLENLPQDSEESMDMEDIEW